MRLQQERQAQELFAACQASGHQFLLELIPPADSVVDDTTASRAVQRFYNVGVRPDWWKLPPQSAASWESLTQLIEQRDPHCQGVVLLGLAASMETVKQGFQVAAQYPLCKGFTVGRTLFAEPSRQWMLGQINDEQLIQAVADNYIELINAWQELK
jgi:5-dehydro-2-deoxygluconokinase